MSEERVEQLREASRKLRRLALVLVEEVLPLLSDEGSKCECCGATRYKFWAQKSLRERVNGAAVRLDEIADEFYRRCRDPEFVP